LAKQEFNCQKLFFFSLIPGLPNVPFLLLAAVAAVTGRLAAKAKERAAAEDAAKERVETAADESEQVKAVNPYDMLEMEVGYALIPLVDVDRDGEVVNRIKSLRNQLALELGLVIPPIHIRDNLRLAANEYVILMKGVEIAKGELMMGHYLAMDAGQVKGNIEGIPTREPAFGLNAMWVSADDKDAAQMMGYTVVDVSTVLTTHLMEIIRGGAFDLLGRQELQEMLDWLARTHPKLVEEVVPGLLPLGVVLNVLKNLLKERISIRDILTIMEALADYGTVTKDPELLTEYARQRLSRAITKQYQDENGEIRVITLDDEVENVIAKSVGEGREAGGLAIDPASAKKILAGVKSTLEKVTEKGQQPIVLCPAGIRRAFKKLAEIVTPDIVALSYDEIAPTCTVKSVATVRL